MGVDEFWVTNIFDIDWYEKLKGSEKREIFRERILESNPNCKIIDANGLNGQGAAELALHIIRNTKEISKDEQLRHNAPFSVCTLCAGERKIGSEHHRGLLREMNGLQTYIGE